ncbi:hypothetical protein SEUCBS140593_001524 [Sporothrix eucalyptigena]|uniref:Amino acid transporter transmembrane domain-containing protein n=1 Tax=Sporothrix eucalyptigena TaxID=1812306 RepID=A0ABP0AYX0_9PEZI
MASNQATNVDERATQVSLLSPAPSLVRRDSYLDTGTLLGHDRNYISLLLVPAGVAFGALGCPPVLIFLVNFLALIPLTLLVMEMVIHLSYHAGSAKGGLLRAILGNAVELLVPSMAPLEP